MTTSVRSSRISSASADDRLVLGHRLSEWCGHGPILEEDIALANIALDLIGEATLLLKLAGEVEGQGRNEDALAYFRDGDRLSQRADRRAAEGRLRRSRSFASSSSASSHCCRWTRCSESTNAELAGIAAKAVKEARYHVRHSAQWVVTLGDGTEESHGRAQQRAWMICGATRASYSSPTTSIARPPPRALASIRSTLADAWRTQVRRCPAARDAHDARRDSYMQRGGRDGKHTEHLGHMLSEMQIVARSHPGRRTW